MGIQAKNFLDKRWHVRLEHILIGKQEETFPVCTISCMHSLHKFCECILYLANQCGQENKAFEASIVVGFHIDPVEKITFRHRYQLIYLICCVLKLPISSGLVSDQLRQKCEKLFAHRDAEFKDMNLALLMLVWKNAKLFLAETCQNSHCWNKLESFTFCNEAKMFFAPQIPKMAQKGSVTLRGGEKTENQSVRLVFRDDLCDDYHPAIFALFRPGDKLGKMQFGLKNYWYLKGRGEQQKLSPRSNILETNVVIFSMLKKSKILEANFRKNQKVKETPTLKELAERKAIGFYSQKIWESNKNTVKMKTEDVPPGAVNKFMVACGKFLPVLENHLKKHVGFKCAHKLTCHIYECFSLKTATTWVDMKKGALVEVRNCGKCRFCEFTD